jgi:WD40 repeat protein
MDPARRPRTAPDLWPVVAAPAEGSTMTQFVRTTGLALCLLGGMFVAPAPNEAGKAVRGSEPRTDLHGDPLPEGAVARFGTVRLCEPTGADFVAFSPDGKLLASISRRGFSISLWDVHSGKLHSQLMCESDPAVIAFAPRSQLLASGHRDKTIRLWDLATGTEVRKLSGHVGTVSALAFSPDGRLLASGGRDENYRAENRGAFTQLVSDDADRTIRLWDPSTGKALGELAGHSKAVTSLLFLAKGTRLVSVSDDATLRCWDVGLRKLQWTKATSGDLSDLASLGPGFLARTCRENRVEGELRLWDLAVGHSTPWPGGKGADTRMSAVSPDGGILAAASESGLDLYEAQTGRKIRRLARTGRWLTSLAFSADGKLLAGATGGPSLRLWDVAGGKELHMRPGHRERVTFARFLPDGKTALSVDCNQQVSVWDMATGKPLRTFEVGDGWRYWGSFDLSADGRFLAVGSWAGTSFWEVAPGRRAGANGRSYDAGRVCFSPDGKMVAVTPSMVVTTGRGPVSSTVSLLEVPSGKELHRFDKIPGFVGSLLFSEDSKYLIVSASAIQLWDLASKNQVPRFPEAAPTMSVRCPGGKYLLSAGGTEELWELDTGKRIQRFGATSDNVWKGLGGATAVLAISPDGRILAMDSGSSTNPGIQLRELLTGKRLGCVEGHQGSVESLAFSPDSRYLLSAGADGTVLVWDAAAAIRKHLARTVTLAPGDLLRLWTDLGAEEEATAFRAVDRLVEAPRQTLPWLAKRLRPVSTEDIDRLLGDLDSPSFARRQEAMAELQRREFAAQPALQRGLEGKPSLELRRRVELLLQKLDRPMTEPSVLRAWRSLAVLEQLGSEEAKALLERLARGSPHAHLSQQARAALARWSCLPRVRLLPEGRSVR